MRPKNRAVFAGLAERLKKSIVSFESPQTMTYEGAAACYIQFKAAKSAPISA